MHKKQNKIQRDWICVHSKSFSLFLTLSILWCGKNIALFSLKTHKLCKKWQFLQNWGFFVIFGCYSYFHTSPWYKKMVYSIQIVVWISLHNKYVENGEALAPCRQIFFFKNCEALFCILQCNFGYNQYGWIKCGYSLKKCNLVEINFCWEKNCFAFLVWFKLYNCNN